jgi:hypothetical protein
LYVRYREKRNSAVQRQRVLASGGLLEIHREACQQAVVNFMFAAMPDDAPLCLARNTILILGLIPDAQFAEQTR